MRHSVDGQHHAIAYAKEARTGADENRSIAILDDAGDELRFEQVRSLHRVYVAGGKVKETGVCAHPETSLMVWKDGTDGVAGGFDAQQIVMKSMGVITIDAVEPRAYPNALAPVFGDCADGRRNRHSRRIGGDETPVMPAEEPFAPGAEP